MQEHTLPLARYRSLDFWRGIACLSVVVHHSACYATHESSGSFWGLLVRLTTHLRAGVPIFFVISGFCIAAAADGQRRNGYSPRRYFLRRIRRIYPPFLIFLAIASAAVILGEFWSPGLFDDDRHPIFHPSKLTPLQWLGNVTLTESWRWNLGGDPCRYAQHHAWTLCYEEQFYAVVGVALLIWPRRVGWILAAVTAAVVILPERFRLEGFFFDGKWLHFAIGTSVYYAVNYAPRWQRWGLVVLLAAIAVHSRINQGNMMVASAFGGILILMAPFDRQFSMSRWTRPISWCGLMCYSIYLVHAPVCKAISHALWRAGLNSDSETMMITVPVCMGASLIASTVFFRQVERRFLN